MRWMAPDETEWADVTNNQKVRESLGLTTLGSREGMYSVYNQIKNLRKQRQIGSKITEELNR